MKDIRSLGRKKVTLSEIGDFYKINEYRNLYETVIRLIQEGILKPVKKSGTNGKSPALFLAYWVELIKEDNTEFLDELKYLLNPKLDTGYYINNIPRYKEDREYIIMLSEYITNFQDKLENRISLNERSFEIWGREKFLSGEGGKRIIRNLGLTEEYLNYYHTTVPLAYYSHSKKTPQNVLILENKDTFYSMRKHLLENNNIIFSTEISTLVYGGGKNIHKSFEDFHICVEPYISNNQNTILYFGDLDYEGIIIYESLKKSFENKYRIRPFIEGYMGMIDKYEKMDISLPKTKEGQNRNISEGFLGEFDGRQRERIMKILQADEYIPQEILNIGDF